MNLFLIFLTLFLINLINADNEQIANINDCFIKSKINETTTLFEIKNLNLSKNNFGGNTIMGDNKFNTLNLSQLVSDVIIITNNYVYNRTKKLFKFENFNKIIGRKMKPDYIYIKCNPSKVNTQGGLDAYYIDFIKIGETNVCNNDLFIDIYPFTNVENPALQGKYYYNIKDYNTNSSQPLLYEFDFKLKKDDFLDRVNFNIRNYFFNTFNRNYLSHNVFIPHSLNDIENIYQNSPSKITIEFNTKQKIVINGNEKSQIYCLIQKDDAYLIVEENDYYFHIYTDKNINDSDYFLKIARKIHVSIYIFSVDQQTFRYSFKKQTKNWVEEFLKE